MSKDYTEYTRHTGYTHCEKCGKMHWLHDPCPETQGQQMAEQPNRRHREEAMSNPDMSAISCSATNPGQWITLYEDGRVGVRTRNLDTAGAQPYRTITYRTLTYRPKLKSDREAIRRLIGHLNLVAGGDEGVESF